MISETRVTQYQGLQDPISGEDLAVFMTEAEGRVTYRCPTAVSLMRPRASVAALMTVLTTRNGIIGAASSEEAMKCPYSGRQLSIQTLSDGRAFAIGAFDPTLSNPDIFNFLYNLRMRKGIPAPGTLEHQPSFEGVEAKPKAKPAKSSVPSAAAAEAAEGILKHVRKRK